MMNGGVPCVCDDGVSVIEHSVVIAHCAGALCCSLAIQTFNGQMQA